MGESFDHVCHEHPLSLIPDWDQKRGGYVPYCCGCLRYFLPGDATYGCGRGCGFKLLLHKECVEMPREIMHPIHPSHPLTLHFDTHFSHPLTSLPLTLHFDTNFTRSEVLICAVCKYGLRGISYRCSQGGCEGLWIHMLCARGLSGKADKPPLMYHPSHPEHQLRFSKKTRWCPFPCDACGATEKGDSYTCTLCDYSIHQSCALLPESKDFPLHHHPLSLSFYLPFDYIVYGFECAICYTTLSLTCWVYHCHLCSYVVHLNCATSTFANDEEVTRFPMAVDDMYEEMIVPFIKRERGQIFIPPDHHNHNIVYKYISFSHPHQLDFITFSSSSSSSSSSHHHYKIDDDEDGFESIPRWELICDGCTLPIHQKKQRDDDEYENGYLGCDECKYFLHFPCFNLPAHIPSPPIHPLENHSLRLQNADKMTGWINCDICYGYTNGLYYACTNNDCRFKIDVKCASLPNTIKHAAHLRHNYLKLLTNEDIKFGNCSSCFEQIITRSGAGKYKCNSCKFVVCGKCVMLPPRNKHRSEKHFLSLTYDAYVNRPGEFYCSNCEEQIHPRSWMYHCRDCDQSFHPKCFPATSGEYKNIKYGTEPYVISGIHDHRLRFQIISKKKRCDLCRADVYDKPGFQCASCFFVVCKSCGTKHMDDA